MRITEVDKGLTQNELDQLEVFADRLFAKVGIDVEFTRHFLDRVNDERNVKQITASELTRLFKQEYKRWGKPIAQMGPDSEAVLKDLATDVNIPFALRWDKENNELDLIAKTVMRKKNFKTSNKEFEVQSVDYSLDNIQHKKVFESIQQLNEAGPAALAVPVGIAAWNAYVYSRYAQAAWFTAKFTATTAAAYIVANADDFGWLERKMASSAILAYQLWDKVRGVQDMSSVQWRDTNASAMAAGQQGAENPLGPRPTADIDGDPYGIINARQQVAAGQLGAQARLDLALADLAADQKAWDIESNRNKDKDASAGAMASGQTGATLTQLTLDASQQLNGELAAGVSELTANANIETEIDNEELDKIAIATANAQNLVSDNNLIKLATTVTQARQNDDSDAQLISLATKIATAQQAAAKVTAQNTASDAKLIALGQQVAQQEIDTQNATSDAKLIGLAQQLAGQQANDVSDAKLIALGQAYKDAKTNAASDAKLIALANAVNDVNIELDLPIDGTKDNDVKIDIPAEIPSDVTTTYPGDAGAIDGVDNPKIAYPIPHATDIDIAGPSAIATTLITPNNNNNKKGLYKEGW